MLKNSFPIIILIILTIILNACAGSNKIVPSSQLPPPTHTDIPELQAEYELMAGDIEIERLFEELPEDAGDFEAPPPTELPVYSIPITMNNQVWAFIKAYRGVRRQNIQNALNRSTEFIEDFKRIFREHGMPEDLAYLPIIESGFRSNAISRARARGMWQFMASTAQMYGMRVDWIVDERRDPYKSCVAAARYLKDLHEKFDDWYLALACYNGGTRRVTQAMRHLKTKDFFTLSKSRHYLRRETRNYIPAFIASLLIAKAPEQYGFTIENQEHFFAQTKKVQTPSPVSLLEMAKLLNVSYDELKRINPELANEFTPFNKQFYDIRIPIESDETLLPQLKRLPPEKKLFVGWYQVRRGDSLYSIACKFNTSVTHLKKTNKLHSNLIHPGKQLLIPRGN